ncbi:universal stress protein [Achromobacter deleyi]|uniref:universal stress protein n=1 Tax=Achromobacter deleyi TaxID=1353891 RepID=UPI001491ED46|nr:universal stress protein [Achromobacter deleyi]QVQ26593.1 universal stress protein [Achromobacter deleyi]UIP22167.1 universal stress protein [Achromobacter deleyi]
MLNILVPVDGSDNANRAVVYARRLAQGAKYARIHLLNIQTPPRGRAGVSRLITQDMINDFYAREGREASEEARKLLDAAGVDYASHVVFGHAATEIAGYAQDHGCARIVMGTRGNGSLVNILIGSVANQVVQLAQVPVTLVK